MGLHHPAAIALFTTVSSLALTGLATAQSACGVDARAWMATHGPAMGGVWQGESQAFLINGDDTGMSHSDAAIVTGSANGLVIEGFGADAPIAMSLTDQSFAQNPPAAIAAYGGGAQVQGLGCSLDALPRFFSQQTMVIEGDAAEVSYAAVMPDAGTVYLWFHMQGSYGEMVQFWQVASGTAVPAPEPEPEVPTLSTEVEDEEEDEDCDAPTPEEAEVLIEGAWRVTMGPGGIGTEEDVVSITAEQGQQINSLVFRHVEGGTMGELDGRDAFIVDAMPRSEAGGFGINSGQGGFDYDVDLVTPPENCAQEDLPVIQISSQAELSDGTPIDVRAYLVYVDNSTLAGTLLWTGEGFHGRQFMTATR